MTGLPIEVKYRKILEVIEISAHMVRISAKHYVTKKKKTQYL